MFKEYATCVQYVVFEGMQQLSCEIIPSLLFACPRSSHLVWVCVINVKTVYQHY